jgi:hypothetical protein
MDTFLPRQFYSDKHSVGTLERCQQPLSASCSASGLLLVPDAPSARLQGAMPSLPMVPTLYGLRSFGNVIAYTNVFI